MCRTLGERGVARERGALIGTQEKVSGGGEGEGFGRRRLTSFAEADFKKKIPSLWSLLRTADGRRSKRNKMKRGSRERM